MDESGVEGGGWNVFVPAFTSLTFGWHTESTRGFAKVDRGVWAMLSTGLAVIVKCDAVDEMFPIFWKDSVCTEDPRKGRFNSSGTIFGASVVAGRLRLWSAWRESRETERTGGSDVGAASLEWRPVEAEDDARGMTRTTGDVDDDRVTDAG